MYNNQSFFLPPKFIRVGHGFAAALPVTRGRPSQRTRMAPRRPGPDGRASAWRAGCCDGRRRQPTDSDSPIAREPRADPVLRINARWRRRPARVEHRPYTLTSRMSSARTSESFGIRNRGRALRRRFAALAIPWTRVRRRSGPPGSTRRHQNPKSRRSGRRCGRPAGLASGKEGRKGASE